MDKYDVNQLVQLKKGVYKLNAERNFDYQLNRVINWDGGKIEDIRPVAGKIKTSSDWKRELIALGDKAMEEGRTQNAIAYYRMSEFFMYDGDHDKKAYYEKATQLFYQYYTDYFEGENPRIEKLECHLLRRGHKASFRAQPSTMENHAFFSKIKGFMVDVPGTPTASKYCDFFRKQEIC